MPAGGAAGGRKALMTRAASLQSSLRAQAATADPATRNRLESKDNRIYLAVRDLRRASSEERASDAQRRLSHAIRMGR